MGSANPVQNVDKNAPSLFWVSQINVSPGNSRGRNLRSGISIVSGYDADATDSIMLLDKLLSYDKTKLLRSPVST